MERPSKAERGYVACVLPARVVKIRKNRALDNVTILNWSPTLRLKASLRLRGTTRQTTRVCHRRVVNNAPEPFEKEFTEHMMDGPMAEMTVRVIYATHSLHTIAIISCCNTVEWKSKSGENLQITQGTEATINLIGSGWKGVIADDAGNVLSELAISREEVYKHDPWPVLYDALGNTFLRDLLGIIGEYVSLRPHITGSQMQEKLRLRIIAAMARG
jgi:hypothetical protein